MKKLQINKSKLQFSKEKVATLTSREMKTFQGGVAASGASVCNLCFPPPSSFDPNVCITASCHCTLGGCYTDACA